MTENEELALSHGVIKGILKAHLDKEQWIAGDAVEETNRMLTRIVNDIGIKLADKEKFPYHKIKKEHLMEAADDWMNMELHKTRQKKQRSNLIGIRDYIDSMFAEE